MFMRWCANNWPRAFSACVIYSVSSKMTYLSVLFLALFFLSSVPSLAACTGSSPTWTSTPDYASVSSCVSGATAGDTINVGSGSVNWSNKLSIAKGINLIGAGIDNTIIVSTAGHIDYQPANYSLNAPFRVSGFTFDLGGSASAHAINLGYPGSYRPAPDQTKIRIDHNKFTNGAASGCSTSAHALSVVGPMYGVVDNNIMTGIYYPIDAGSGALSGVNYGGQWSWNNWHLTFGEIGNNLYYEDNGINWGQLGCHDGGMSQCQFSGRYAFRYNTITGVNDGQPIIDMHGNAGGGVGDENAMWACFGGELYGNQVNAGGDWLNQRGGEVLSFYNNFTQSAYIAPTEEHADAEEPTTNPEPQHVHNTYYWNNRLNNTGAPIEVRVTSTINGVPAQNQDFWTDSTSSGTAGVFCGTLANRPAACTVGQGYWATDQSCTNLTGLVGDKGTYPSRSTISGTLYKCAATNTWIAYYQPLSYPHPLRVTLPPPFLRPPVVVP